MTRHSRDIHDILHKIVAVGSRDTTKAKEFVDTHALGEKSIKIFGTYEEVYHDKVVCWALKSIHLLTETFKGC